MAKPDLILFDWDGVIFNYKEAMRRGYAALARLGISQEDAEKAYLLTKGKNYTPAVNADILASATHKSRGEVLDAILSGYENMSELVFPDVMPCIEKLKSRGAIGILTAGDEEYQGWKIVGSDVRHHFDFVVTVPATAFQKFKSEKITELLMQYEHVTFLDDTFTTIQAVSEKCGGSGRIRLYWVNRLGATNVLPKGVKEIHSLADAGL